MMETPRFEGAGQGEHEANYSPPSALDPSRQRIDLEAAIRNRPGRFVLFRDRDWLIKGLLGAGEMSARRLAGSTQSFAGRPEHADRQGPPDRKAAL
jgi:hypothetical protein